MDSGEMSTQSIFFLQTIDHAIESARSTSPFLDETLPPSEILSLSDKFLRVVKDIDIAVSTVISTSKQMKELYRLNVIRCSSLRNTFIDRVNERKASGAQLNMNVELYDDDHIIQVVASGENNIGLTVTELRKPGEYSVLKLYQRMQNIEPLILGVMEHVNSELFLLIEKELMRCREAANNFQTLFTSQNFMMVMSTDKSTSECSSYISIIQSSIRHIISSLEKIKTKTTNVFQANLALLNNFKIYEEAVNTLTSIALEGVFNPYADWVLI